MKWQELKMSEWCRQVENDGLELNDVTEKQEHTHTNTNLKWKSRWNVIPLNDLSFF